MPPSASIGGMPRPADDLPLSNPEPLDAEDPDGLELESDEPELDDLPEVDGEEPENPEEDHELDPDPDDSAEPGDDDPELFEAAREGHGLDVGRAMDLLSLPNGDALEDDDADGVPGMEHGSPSEIDEPPAADEESDALDETSFELDAPVPSIAETEDDDEGVNDFLELPARAAFGDEPLPGAAAESYTEAGRGLVLEACAALDSVDAIVVAASSDLFWFAPGELSPVRLEAGSSEIHAVALVGSGWEYAICSTSSGKLFRRGRLASASEELKRLPIELGGINYDPIDLCQPGTGFPHALLVRTSSGQIFRSDDDGGTFRRVMERKILVLTARGVPAMALSVDGALLTSADGGGSFVEAWPTGLPPELFQSGVVSLCAAQQTVLLSNAELGIFVSSDAGASFRRLSGTRSVTAICLGERAGTTLGWASLYDDAADETALIRIDPISLEVEIVARIASIATDDDSGEAARALRLAWDPVHVRLWAAGGFGVRAFNGTSR